MTNPRAGGDPATNLSQTAISTGLMQELASAGPAAILTVGPEARGERTVVEIRLPDGSVVEADLYCSMRPFGRAQHAPGERCFIEKQRSRR